MSQALDEHVSQHLTWRGLLECSTYKRLKREMAAQDEILIAALPHEAATWAALRQLAVQLLDPIIEQFGAIEITYGFAPPTLTRHIRRHIAPRLDQHAGSELRKGSMICERGGAAVDFRVLKGPSMRTVAEWAMELPVDRMYFYGDDRPLHISWHPQPGRSFYQLIEGRNGRRLPRPFAAIPIGDD